MQSIGGDLSADNSSGGFSGKIFLWAITSALSGFLFGFDTVVISGAEKTIQDLWQLSDLTHGIIIGSALYGTVVGSLIGGWPSDRFGRRGTLLWIGVLYLLSALGTAFAPGPWVFLIARLIGGLGIGISTVVAPMYIAEISPPQSRGKLAGMFQFNIVFGILVAYASNYGLSHLGPNSWRWMLGVAAIPSVIYALMCFTLPESPRWLIGRVGQRARGIDVLRMIRPELSETQLEAQADDIAGGTANPGVDSKLPFFRAELSKPIMLAFLIAFFNQLSGINAILYFAPRIFEQAGLGVKDSLAQSIMIGVTNLVFTFVGLGLIDKLGRRTLLYIGSFGYIASLGLCSWAFYTNHFSIVPYCIFAFIASHAIGQGTVIWVFIGEIFPNQDRASGQSLGSSTHWVFCALLSTVFPIMIGKFPPGAVFAFFCFMMVLQLIWVATMVPETKGVSLEEIQRRLSGNRDRQLEAAR